MEQAKVGTETDLSHKEIYDIGFLSQASLNFAFAGSNFGRGGVC